MSARRTALTVLLATLCVLALAATAVAADFSPTINFLLSTKKINGNGSVTVTVAQDKGEEELKTVVLSIPKGFKLPTDAAIPNGTAMGSGIIKIATGVGTAACVGPQITVNVNIKERDRTPAEIASKVVGVWVVDLQPVTTIDLLVKGSSTAGWTLTGAIPANDLTCPPFSFQAAINPKAGTTPIIVNPSTAGTYTFSATFTGVSGSKKTITQKVTITK